ncbi:MAG: hypothetical protein HY241_00365 [Actinobacteria bacterium]|nr:hypothetical protein [Actinomycetota bacterium]
MGVTVGRVSQIESGDVSGIDVLDRYVTAIGGLLEIVANFGDEQFKGGRRGCPGPVGWRIWFLTVG